MTVCTQGSIDSVESTSVRKGPAISTRSRDEVEREYAGSQHIRIRILRSNVEAWTHPRKLSLRMAYETYWLLTALSKKGALNFVRRCTLIDPALP